MTNSLQAGVSRRWFLGAMGSAGAFAGCRAIPFSCGDRPLLRFGVVSDVHVRLADNGETLDEGYDTSTFEKTLAYYRDMGVDAVVIAGDMADTGLFGELKAVAAAWFKVFPNDRAPDGRKVERVFVYGNHDAYGLRMGDRVYKSESDLRREALEVDPQRTWDACFHEEWKQFFVKNVKGFDFYCSHWTPGIWCNGFAEVGCSGCWEVFREKMRAADLSKPFFYVQHPHPRDTVYGKGAWGADDGSASDLLSSFPQAVAFSGHSHEPLSNERAMWRGSFTSVATGSLRYLSAGALWNRIRTNGYENGGCNFYLPGVVRADRPKYIAKYDAPKMMPVETSCFDIRVGQLVSVYEDRIEFAKREFVSGLDIGAPWIVERPARPRAMHSFAKEAVPAQFPAGATLTAVRTKAATRGMEQKGGLEVASSEQPALKLKFPAATEGGCVAEYEISAASASGDRWTTRVCAISGLYPRSHANFSKGVVATVPFADIPAGAKSVCVTPLDSFGNRGRPLTASL